MIRGFIRTMSAHNLSSVFSGQTQTQSLINERKRNKDNGKSLNIRKIYKLNSNINKVINNKKKIKIIE